MRGARTEVRRVRDRKTLSRCRQVVVNGGYSQERAAVGTEENSIPRIGFATAVDNLNDSAIVVERCAAAEVSDGREDVIHGRALPCYNLEAIAVEHVSAGV